MPNLPTISLPQAHYDRVVAAFPGDTPAEKAEAYRAWTVNRLIERVEQVESWRIDAEFQATKAKAMKALSDSLPPKSHEPELP